MPRIRYLKPDFFTDEDIAELPDKIKIFYMGLWCYADKAGRIEDRSKKLKVEIMPYAKKFDSEKALEELTHPKKTTGRPFILRYNIDGERFIQIIAWGKNQKPHKTERESEIPAPPKELLTVKYPLSNGGLTSYMGKGKGKGKGTDKGEGECPYEDIITDLNSIINASYKPTTPKTRELISARLKDGFTLENFKTVHRKMAQAWGVDNKMRQYLRPQTLYSIKFESYLNRPDDLKVSLAGAKTYQAGQKWLEDRKKK